MLDEQIKVLRFLQSYGDSLIADIDAAEFRRQPVAGMNPPAWIIGHLAFACDRHATLLGVEPQLADWKELFGKGSAPDSDASKYPPKDELVNAWHAANDRLIAAVEAATPQDLAKPNDYLKNPGLPTLGDFFTFSMTGHTSLHIGQLSAWRRAAGRAPLF